MALDAGIILQGAQPQQTPNLLAQYAQIRAQKQQADANAIGIQQQQLQLQQAQQQQAYQKQAMQSLSSTGGDLDKTIEQLRTAGNPEYFTFLKHKQDAQKMISGLQKDAAEAQKNNAEAQNFQDQINSRKIEHASGVLQKVLDSPDALKPYVYSAATQLIPPDLLQQAGLPAQYQPGVESHIQAAVAQGIQAKDQIAQRQRQSELDQQAKHQTAEEAQAQATLAQTKAHDTALEGNMAAQRQLEQQRIGLEGKRVGIEAANLGMRQKEFQQNYGDASGNLSSGQQSVVDAIVRGDRPMPPLRAKGAIAIQQAVLQADPSYSDSRYQARKDFKTGKDANDIQALGTAIEHAKRFAENSGKMGGIESFTSGLNVTGNQRRLSEDGNLLAGEVGRLVVGGVVPEGELKQIQDNLKSPSNDVRLQAANELMQLAGGKVQAKIDKYQSATGMKFDPSLLSDRTHKALTAVGINTRGSAQAQPASSVQQTAQPGKRPSLDSIFGGK